MKISVTTNALDVSGFMRDLMRDQLPFATAQAVRRTALDFQDAQRQHQRNVFTVRNSTFLDRAVKIRDWPTKQDPTAIVRIEPPGGRKRAHMILDHEEGERSPGPGSRAYPAALDARPSRGSVVPKRLHPRALKFKKMLEAGAQDPGNVGYVQVFRGKDRTFMIRYRDGSGFIFQRTGRGITGTFAGTRLLWVLVPGGVELPGNLDFRANAQKVVERVWGRNMGEAWDRALRTAR